MANRTPAAVSTMTTAPKSEPDIRPETQRSERSRQVEPTVTLGSSGLVQFSGYVDEEWHRALRGVQGVKTYREMTDNDATIGAAFALIDAQVRQVPWRVEPAADGEAEALFVEECLNDMSHTWTDFVSDALSMMGFGWSAFEKIYKHRLGPGEDPTKRSRYTDGKLGWRKIAPRAQDTLDRWAFQDDGGIDGFWQVAPPRYDPIFLPIGKLILFRTTTRKGNPEGRSLLRNAYRSWFFCKRMQEVEGIGIERELAGLPVLELPIAYFDTGATAAKKAAKADFVKLLKQIRRNEHEGVALPTMLDAEGKPTGYKLSLLSTGGGRQIDVSSTIKRYQRDIGQTLFSQFLFLGLDGVGSLALSQTFTEVFSSFVASLLDIIEETFHRFGTMELCALNGIPPEKMPRIKHGDVQKRDLRPLAEMLMKLVGAGVLTPDSTLEDYVRSEGRLPEREEGAEDDEEVADDDDASATARRMRRAQGDEDEDEGEGEGEGGGKR